MQACISFCVISIVITTSAAAYLLPTLVAWLRHTSDLGAVAVINLALGWTLLGWIVALAIALRRHAGPAVLIINQVHASGPAVDAPAASRHSR